MVEIVDSQKHAIIFSVMLDKIPAEKPSTSLADRSLKGRNLSADKWMDQSDSRETTSASNSQSVWQPRVPIELN